MVDLDGLKLGGVSIGGFATCLDLPDLKVCVDVGRLLDDTVPRNVVLVTHTHADHVGALAQHVAQRAMRRMEPAVYVVPPGTEFDLEAYLAVWRALDHGKLPATIRPVAPGDEIHLRRDLVARPFATDHRVVSQGYLFERRSHRLRPEFEGRTGKELAALRREGVSIEEEVREPLLAITGDTRIDGVLAHPEVLACPRLVMETTFMDDRIDVEGARHRGHVHLDEVAAHADAFGCRTLLLNHVSQRHDPKSAARLVRERLPAHLAERTRVQSNVLGE